MVHRDNIHSYVLPLGHQAKAGQGKQETSQGLKLKSEVK